MNHSKKLNVLGYLKELRALVDQHLEQAISVYQNLPEEELNRPSLEGGWSIAQCLDHLNSYGGHYLPRLKQAVKIRSNPHVPVVKRGWLGDYFIKMMDPDRKSKHYKAAKQHIPKAQLDAHEVVAVFITQQEALLQLLDAAASANLNRIRIPISLTPMIRLRLGDTFAFLIIHDERHIRQANRNLQAFES